MIDPRPRLQTSDLSYNLPTCEKSSQLRQRRAALGAKRPSLNALRALEATVRVSSMTSAAEELSVTHGAISRHNKKLEEMFGIPLVLRGTRSVVATPEGARLANDLSNAFALIASSVEQLQPGPLTLSC